MTDAATVRTFEDKVGLAERRIAAVSEWEAKSEVKLKSLQVAAGEALLDVRASVEAGEVGELADWWGWFEDNIRACSRKTAERWMMFAGAPEPEAVVLEFKAQDAARKRVERQQPRGEVPSDVRGRWNLSRQGLQRRQRSMSVRRMMTSWLRRRWLSGTGCPGTPR